MVLVDLIGNKKELKALRGIREWTPILALDDREKKVDSLIIYAGNLKREKYPSVLRKDSLDAYSVAEFGRAIKSPEGRVIGGSDLDIDYLGDIKSAYLVFSSAFSLEELGMLNLNPRREIQLIDGRVSYNPSILIVGRDLVVDHLRKVFRDDLRL